MKRTIYFSLILLTVVFGCKRDDDDALHVPRIATDVTININLPGFSALANPGGWVYVNGGSRGIIVYRSSINSFSAFDRHCPYQVEQGCKINVLDGTIAEDEECCHSQFEIITGTPVSGSADRTLQHFNTQFNPNANLLRIYN